MHRVREVLRLKHVCRLSNRKIARACGVDRDTVGMYLKRAEKAGLGWPLPETLDDCELEARLFPKPAQKPPGAQRSLPDCQYIYEELRSYKKKASLTLMQPWFEHKESHPEGYQYTQFCDYYRRWRGKLDYCMRQEHRAGEKVFVDYCGGPAIVDQGQLRETLNPFELSAAINKKLATIWALASKANLRSAEKPKASKKEFWRTPQEYELPTNIFLPMRNIEISRLRAQWARESRLNIN